MDNDGCANRRPSIYPGRFTTTYTYTPMRGINIPEIAGRTPVVTVDGIITVKVVNPRNMRLEIGRAIGSGAIHILGGKFGIDSKAAGDRGRSRCTSQYQEAVGYGGLLVGVHTLGSQVN